MDEKLAGDEGKRLPLASRPPPSSGGRRRGWDRLTQTGLVFIGFLLLGLARAMQGPTIGDLRDQAGVRMEDFSKVFLLGTFSFPLGNLAAGLILDKARPDPMLLMTGVGAVFFVFHTGMAFTFDLLSLTATSTVMEFAMGMLDTGCNVICLNLWRGDDREGPYFTALHAFFNVGNIIGPIFAGLILERHAHKSSDNEHVPGLSRLQLLHLLVGAIILVLTLSYLVCFAVGFARRRTSVRRDREDKYLSNNNEDAIVIQPLEEKVDHTGLTAGKPMSPFRRCLLIGIMAAFFCCFNGTNFAFFTFLTELVMSHSALQLSKRDGATATTVYFIASTMARMASALAVSRLRSPAILVALDLLVLIFGSVWMYHSVSPSALLAPHASLLVGCVLVGVGVSTLFSSGVLWLLGVAGPLSGAVTSVFLVSTSLGAQLFKIPVPLWIDGHPVVVIHVVSFGAAACTALFSAALVLAWNKGGAETRENKLKEAENSKPLIETKPSPQYR